MFSSNSRYANAATYTATTGEGRRITAVRFPPPSQGRLLGFHQRLDGQRLDLIASFYLRDATAFWRICDANNAVVPDALAAHEEIGIPEKGR
jgi:hypothetical protein